MSPVRLVILAILFYLAWKLIRGLGKEKTQTVTDRQRGQDSRPVEDVLVEDPVCHTLIPKHQAIRLRREGKTYFFCSEKCCDSFTDDAGGEK